VVIRTKSLCTFCEWGKSAYKEDGGELEIPKAINLNI